MQHTTPVTLDMQELMHLALEAADRNDHGGAISYLKQALDLPEGASATSSDYAKLLYLLGAEYAQIGMVERAAENMSSALAMDSSLVTARYQLGLLLLTSGAAAQALEVLAPLQSLGEGHALFHLGSGLTHLIKDEAAESKQQLLLALQANQHSATPNVPLNGDIQTLLQSLANLDQQGTADGAQPTEQTETQAEAGFMMSAYHRQNADGSAQ